jgi:aryl-alcohol dehydrogenase-like predicted oxidoreductase
MLKGFATAEGTARYRDRFPELQAAGHFRRHRQVPGAGDLWISSIGAGTYLGEPTPAADANYTAAITAALRGGINLLDTAINYRHQRSERNIGAAVAELASSGGLQRDEIVICTKAGYLAFDGDMPADPRAYFMSEYVENGILDPRELAGGMHCMSPRYLEDQIERSCRNLGVETLDVFYVHNPETQLSAVDHSAFHARLKSAFELLEGAVHAGKIRWYGAATWNGFRVQPTARDYLNLTEILGLARQVGGEQHHFRFIQLPYNLAMLEAYALPNQGSPQKLETTMALAEREGVIVVGSASIYQGQLASNLPQFIRQHLGMESDAGNALQFSRSTPGMGISLVGMGRPEHVVENLKIAAKPLASEEEFRKLFREQ